MKWNVLRQMEKVLSPLGVIREAGVIGDSLGVPWRSMRTLGFYSISYTLEGKAVYRDAAGHSATLTPGSVVFIFPGEPHFYGPEKDGHWNELYVAFEGPVFDLWLRESVMQAGGPVLSALPVNLWVEALEGVLLRAPIFTAIQQNTLITDFVHLLAKIVARGAEKEGKDEQAAWVEQACHALVHAAGSQIVDWEGLSQELGMSYEGFRRRFKRHVGISPGQYHASRLMSLAGEMMFREELSNKEVAERLGFANEFYFSRRFKQVMHATPQEYRRKLLGDLYTLGDEEKGQSIHHFSKPGEVKQGGE